jgi:hypothetical protein
MYITAWTLLDGEETLRVRLDSEAAFESFVDRVRDDFIEDGVRTEVHRCHHFHLPVNESLADNCPCEQEQIDNNPVYVFDERDEHEFAH